jgi:AcrR family transcriptional regulator
MGLDWLMVAILKDGSGRERLALRSRSRMDRTSANSPRKRPRQARSRALVDAILEAAARVFVEDGFQAASTNRIARAAGVSVGSLYQYFPSKDALLAAISERATDRMAALIQTKLAEPADASLAERVEAVIGGMIEFYGAEPELQRIMVLEHARTGTDERVQASENAAADIVRAGLIALSTEKQTPIRDLDAAVFVIVHAVQGVTLARAVREPRGVTDEALARELTALVLRYAGIEPRGM